MSSTSTDHGKIWTTRVDASSSLGLKNVQFPEVIASVNNRALLVLTGRRRRV
ncbi:MAG: hypothetical protein QOK05_2600 [Chloroflexota bacterium]|jgi:hypothetical protein|nr:hypothetical protein [Chloroflexota bacterium]